MRHFIAFLIFTTSSHVTAQVPALYNHISNDVHIIHSKILNQERHIYIHNPKRDSSEAGKAFPVLYLLDGENHFHIVSAYIDYLSHWKVIPKTIVVGIISIDRRKDLTPTNSLLNFDRKIDSSYKTTGGNEQFLQFIRHELMPYVEANYKASSFKILAGHSFGGISTINCMFNHPDMFDAYIAVSPSLWWDSKYVLKLSAQKLKELSTFNKKFFYSNGNEDGSFRGDMLDLDSLINQSGLKGFEHKYIDYPYESHMTEPIPAYYDALRFIYKDWADTKEKK
jgi:predicted alpha/beta superfamily hydrolase